MPRRKSNPLQHLLDNAPEDLPSSGVVISEIHHVRLHQSRRWHQFARDKLSSIFPSEEMPGDINIVMARLIYGLDYVREKRAGEVRTKTVRSVRAAWGIEGGAFDPQLKVLFKITAIAKEERKERGMAGKKKNENTGPKGGKLGLVLGASVTAVIRLLGKEGVKFAEAVEFLTAEGVTEVSPATIRTQLNAGAKGQRGEPATVSATVLKKIQALAKKSAKAKAEKKTPAKTKAPAKKKPAAKKTPPKKKSPPRKKVVAETADVPY